MLENWTIYSWYCPNCKAEVAGLKNKENKIKAKCGKCHTEMVRTILSRSHDLIDLYVPNGGTNNIFEMREY